MKKTRVWILEADTLHKEGALSCVDCPMGEVGKDRPLCAMRNGGIWTIACTYLLHNYEGVGDDDGTMICIVVCSHGKEVDNV